MNQQKSCGHALLLPGLDSIRLWYIEYPFIDIYRTETTSNFCARLSLHGHIHCYTNVLIGCDLSSFNKRKMICSFDVDSDSI